MQRGDKKLIIISAISILTASVAVEFLYWYWLVPRLLQFRNVPLSLWAVVLSPYGVVSLLIGVFIRSAMLIPLHALVAAFISLIGHFGTLFLLGLPPGHDTMWEDIFQPSALIVFVAVLAIVFVVVLLIGYFGRRIFVSAKAA